jgi:predicted RNase H-like HicB family nuclease
MSYEYESRKQKAEGRRQKAEGSRAKRKGPRAKGKERRKHRQTALGWSIINAMTEVTLTTIYEEAEEGGYIGYVAELPGANTQGETLEEVRENLTEAIQLVLEANREEFEKQLPPGSKIKREQLVLRAA